MMNGDYTPPFSIRGLFFGRFLEILPYLVGVGALALIIYLIKS